MRQWEVLQRDPLSEYLVGGEKLMKPEMYTLARERYPATHSLKPLARMGYMLYVS